MSKHKEWLFLFACAPALTGFSVGVFDVALFLMFFYASVRGKVKLSFNSTLLCSFFLSVITLSSILNLDTIVFRNYFQWVLFTLILYILYSLLSSGFFDVYRALKVWGYGIFLNFFAVIIQNVFYDKVLFNDGLGNIHPIPGVPIIRASGLLFNPNYLAAFGILSFIIFIFIGKNKSAVVSGFVAFSSFSKTAFLIPALLLFKIACWGSALKKYFSFVVFFLVGSIFFEKIYKLFEHRMKNANSFSDRLDTVTGILSEKSFTIIEIFFGFGPNMDFAEGMTRVHSKFLGVFFQFGVTGFLLMLAAFFSVAYTGISKSNCKALVGCFLISWFILAMLSSFTFFTYDWIGLFLIGFLWKVKLDSTR
ncbi:hypothetical protein [Aeromonas caviae]|uniref:hypothetical protein n=1 Tax=Aeromonas caviae TaxID=648 RepID=UPI002B45EFD0|nr:hypothetical protein [Aeromonas caviae]